MLSSISFGSLDNLDKLPINSLNSICDRVRQALLHVFLPRLCEKCQPAFSETFKKTQSTPLLLKVLCEPCKISYIKDKRSVSRKKAKPEKPVVTTEEITMARKCPAKKRPIEHSRTEDLETDNPVSTASFNNLTLKIRLISTPKPIDPAAFNYRLPLTPPPSEVSKLDNCNDTEDLTIFIDNTLSDEYDQDSSVSIYEKFTEKGIDWCRYCGVAGETGTFWKLGPWGDRSLCHKHGCEFFGCGFARVTRTRLDLTEFYGEKRIERKKPIISEFCSICWNRFTESDQILSCSGCPISFHKSCRSLEQEQQHQFYCSDNCKYSWKNSLIRPQFPSKSLFPFYRRILLLPTEEEGEENHTVVDSEETKIETIEPVPKPATKLTKLSKTSKVSKLKINLKTLKKKRKHYRKNSRLENQFDRVIAFLPIKVDQTVHVHENIKTPQWTRKSLQERQSYTAAENEPGADFENLDDQVLLNRHARYEHVEKTTRLLKPGVLKQLISDASQ